MSDWDIDREPTKSEQMLARVLSVPVFVILTILMAVALVNAFRNQSTSSIMICLLPSVLWLLSGRVLYGVFFTPRLKPSSKAIVFTGYTIGAMGILLLIGSVITSNNAFYMASIGTTCLCGGFFIIRGSNQDSDS